MKTSLSHLPENNQHEILRIVEIIKEETDPEKIILFGSYAKGTFTSHSYFGRDGIRYEYMSDYDLLVVTNEAQEKSYELEDKVVNRSRMYRSSVNMEIHDIAYINEGLEQGEYFFVDIMKEGILLYDSGNIHFAKSRELSTDEKRIKAQRYFDKWFPQAGDFLHGSKSFLERESFKTGVFMLHQATERLYYTTLLVFTDYKPKTHNLSKLRRQAKLSSEELYLIFPIESNKKEKHLFELLKRGYVDARYRDDYFITKEELSVLTERVKEMHNTVKRICEEKINSII